MISQSFIKELLDRADVYEVVNRRVPLQMKGVNGWACCPFHNEKTSSFSVNREKQFWHCFGCGEHGNAIGFLMKYENLDFPNAVEKLAQECGLKVQYDAGTAPRQKNRPRLTDLMARASEYYQSKFWLDAAAQKYVFDRGLTKETIEKFGIGFAPDGWHNLQAVFSPEEAPLLVEVGLQRTGPSGNAYDFFRNRLMFPIKNVRGQVIAFSARTMIGEEPKYINTGETPIFIKGSEIFGLYEARQAIQESKRAIVVEGQMDVIQLSQAGIREACAPLGTAIKTEHIEKLLKITDHIVFSFDGDKAGQKAARRSMELSLPLLSDSQKATFLFLPSGEDPDSYVKANGKEAFEKLIEQAQPLSSFLLSSIVEGKYLNDLEDKAAVVAEAKPLLRKINSVILRNGLIQRLASVVGVKDSEELAAQLGFAVSRTVRPAPKPWYPKGDKNRASTSRRSIPPNADRPILSILQNFLLYPQLIVEFEQVAIENFSSNNSSAAQNVMALIERVFQEDDSGESIADSIRALPNSKSDSYEAELIKLRGLIEASLMNHPNAEDIKKAVRAGRILNTPLQMSRLETQKFFLTFEKDEIDIKKRQLTEGGFDSEEDRKNYIDLMTMSNKLKKDIESVEKEMYELASRKDF